MNSRSFNLETDYETIQKWAESRSLGRIPNTRLSQYGLMATDSGKEIGACFLYPFQGSEWCMFENLIANPASTPEERERAMSLLFKELCQMAKGMGYKEIFTTSFLPSVTNKLLDMGFVKNNVEVNHFFGRLV